MFAYGGLMLVRYKLMSKILHNILDTLEDHEKRIGCCSCSCAREKRDSKR